MRNFLILAGLVAAVLGYLTVTMREIPRVEISERFAERREVFRDWLAACRPGGACVLTTLGDDPAGEPNGDLLRIESDAAGAPLRIIFLARARAVAQDSPIRAEIDARAPLTLEPFARRGWWRFPEDPPAASRLTRAPNLLPRMRAGARLALLYRDAPLPEPPPAASGDAAADPAPSAAPSPAPRATDADRDAAAAADETAAETKVDEGADPPAAPPPPPEIEVQFSLLGLSAALAWIDENRLR